MGYVSELDWPLWKFEPHSQEAEPAQLLDLEEDVLAAAQARDPQGAGHVDNVFITLAQLDEKFSSAVKPSEENITTTTTPEVVPQSKEKFHTILKHGGLLNGEPIWRKSAKGKGRSVRDNIQPPSSNAAPRQRVSKPPITASEVAQLKEDNPADTTTGVKFDLEPRQQTRSRGKRSRTEVASAGVDSSPKPKKRRTARGAVEVDRCSRDAAGTQKPFQCGRCKQGFNSQLALSGHLPNCLGQCQNCGQHGLACEMAHTSRCRNCKKHNIPCQFSIERGLDDAQQNRIRQRLCSTCGCMIQASVLPTHEKTCRGRCDACRDHNPPLPCRRAFSVDTGCRECSKMGTHCSHSVCNDCGMPQHPYHRCIGKCLLCSETGEPCDSNCRQRCVQCEEKGKTCIFSAEKHDKDSKVRKQLERRLCTECGGLFSEPSTKRQHDKTCKGKCDACISKRIPCRSSRGGGPACVACRETKEPCSHGRA